MFCLYDHQYFNRMRNKTEDNLGNPKSEPPTGPTTRPTRGPHRHDNTEQESAYEIVRDDVDTRANSGPHTQQGQPAYLELIADNDTRATSGPHTQYEPLRDAAQNPNIYDTIEEDEYLEPI